MSRREQRTVDLALAILRRCTQTFEASARCDAMQLALRVLLPYVDRQSLTIFWSIADNPNPSQRNHNLRRQLETIELGARRAVMAPVARDSRMR